MELPLGLRITPGVSLEPPAPNHPHQGRHVTLLAGLLERRVQVLVVPLQDIPARPGRGRRSRQARPAGSDPDTERDGKPSETATRIPDLAAQHQAFREKTGQRQRRMTPREDPDWATLGDTLPSWWARRPDGILRPPRPEITPSAKILQLAAEHDIEPEAGC